MSDFHNYLTRAAVHTCLIRQRRSAITITGPQLSTQRLSVSAFQPFSQLVDLSGSFARISLLSFLATTTTPICLLEYYAIYRNYVYCLGDRPRLE
jgi:hypothetical protein